MAQGHDIMQTEAAHVHQHGSPLVHVSGSKGACMLSEWPNQLVHVMMAAAQAGKKYVLLSACTCDCLPGVTARPPASPQLAAGAQLLLQHLPQLPGHANAAAPQPPARILLVT